MVFTTAIAGAAVSTQLFVATVVCLSRSSDAKTTVENEQKRIAAENNAFDRFATRIEQLEVTSNNEQQVAPASTQLHTHPQSSSVAIESVRSHYKQTVMATDHYTDDYDESLVANIRIEFGPEYAAAIETNEYLTPTLKQGLLHASRTAVQKREGFLTTLHTESRSISDAQRRLDTELDLFHQDEQPSFDGCSFQKIAIIEKRVASLKRICESILEDRQRTIDSLPTRDGVTLQEYLYSTYEWCYPVILDVLDTLTTLQDIEYELIQENYKIN
jgi:hypothetical protein